MAQRMLDNFSGLFGSTSQPAANAQQMAHGYHGEDLASHNGHDGRGGSPGQGSHRMQPEERDEAQDREDLLDQHVAYYLKHHPEVHKKHRISRVHPGVYNFNGREISVEWHYAEEAGEQGYLIAIDGVLRQPFADYMEENDKGVEYDDRRLGKSSLSLIPKGKRLSFGDTNKVYSRLEAMKVAKEQALVREKAADYVKDGMIVPQHELMSKYKKTISVKLGERRQRQAAVEAPLPNAVQVHAHGVAESPVAAPPAESPVLWEPPAAASPAPPPAATSPPRKPASPEKGARTHGAPKYCVAHCKTEQRKKTKPQNKACTACQTVIQTNYREFALCPTCSEKNHSCMCCGAGAVGTAPEPQAREAPSSPMHARASPQQHTKSPAPAMQQQSPMNLFGMPDLMNSAAKSMPITDHQNIGGGLFNGGGLMSAWQGSTPNKPATTPMMTTPQQNNGYVSNNANNAYAPNNAFASQHPMASQSPYAPQTAFPSYNPIAPQSVMPSIVDMRYMN